MLFMMTFQGESENTGKILRVHTDEANHDAMKPIHDWIDEHATQDSLTPGST